MTGSRLAASLWNCVLKQFFPDCEKECMLTIPSHTKTNNNFFILFVLLVKKYCCCSFSSHHTAYCRDRCKRGELPVPIKHASHSIIQDQRLTDTPVTAKIDRVRMYHIPLYRWCYNLHIGPWNFKGIIQRCHRSF